MNPSFFGLEGHPFDRARAEGDAFLSDAHAALTAELHAGLKAPHGITLLIGDEGSGKSTLASAFASQLADTATVAYLPTTGPGLRHLLTEIIEQLGGTDSAATDEQALLDELTRLARARAEHNRITLIILDDAHELPAKTIERLGKLFGDDPAEPSMLHIILVGRGELLDRMNAANDRSILKHLVQVCRMDPIGPEESFRYIADRIAKVGGVVDSLFTEDALHMIVKRANGFPARIDAICTASLDYAEGRGDSNVGTDIVDLACSGVDGFAFEDTTPSGSASYFLDEDGEPESDEMPVSNLDGPMRRSANTPSPLDSRPRASSTDPSGVGNRRRLAVWAIGLIGVVGLFAATMSGTGTDDDLSGLTSGPAGQQLAALPPEDKSDGSVSAEPVAAPKLSLTKQASPDGGSAAAAKAEKKQQILDSLQESATPRRATSPVHATPRQSPPGAATATNQPRVATPPNQASSGSPAAANSGAPEELQVAAARPRVQSPSYAPAAKMAETQPASPASAPAGSQSNPRPTQSDTNNPAAAAQAGANVVRPAAVPKPPATTPRVAAATQAPEPTKPRVPVVAPPTAAQPSSSATPAPTRVAAAPAPAAAVESLPRKYYTVQLGAFGSRANAESLLAKVRTKYSDGRIIAANESGKTVFRVVSGTFTEMAAAKGRAESLSSGGFNTYVRAVGK